MADNRKSLFKALKLPVPPGVLRIRYRVVLKFLGVVLVILGVEFLLCAVLSFAMGEPVLHYVFYILLASLCAVSGRSLYARVPEREVTLPEVAAIASTTFLLASIVGSAPFVFIAGMSVIDAWFEAMSGFTTTGFSLLDVEGSPGSVLFLRAFSQWIGGMGFVVITVSLLLVTGSSAVTFLKESLEERVFPRIVRHVQVVVYTYVALTALGVVLLIASGLGPFDSLLYALSGLSTGGFAPNSAGVSVLDYKRSFLPFVLIMFLGATNFILYYLSWRKGTWRSAASFFKNPQVCCLVVFILLVGVVVSLSLDADDRWIHGFFLAASAQTGTGFYTFDPSLLPPFAMMLLLAPMFVGGSMGSTSGGIKLFRLLEFVRSLNRFLLSRQYPKEVVLPWGGGRGGGGRGGVGRQVKGVAKDELLGIFYVIAAYGALVFLGTAVFVWQGFEPLSSLFEVTSAVGTVGLSAGIVSPELASPLKLFLILLMWAGRLEFLPLFIWAYSFVFASR